MEGWGAKGVQKKIKLGWIESRANWERRGKVLTRGGEAACVV